MNTPGMANERELARQLAYLERHGDRAAEDFLRSGTRARALNGSPLARHVYRLICGHLTEIHGAPLPLKTRTIFCADESCRIDRDVVEWLTRPARTLGGR